MPPTRNQTSIPWESQRERFIALYVKKDLALDDCMVIMENKHGFVASRRQYLRKISEWGIDKKVKQNEMRVAFRKVVERLMDGKDTAVEVRGTLITRDQVKRFMRREMLKRQKKMDHEAKESVKTKTRHIPVATDSWVEATPQKGFRVYTPAQGRGICSPALFRSPYASIINKIMNNRQDQKPVHGLNLLSPNNIAAVAAAPGATKPVGPGIVDFIFNFSYNKSVVHSHDEPLLICAQDEFIYDEQARLGSYIARHIVKSTRLEDVEVTAKVANATQLTIELLRRRFEIPDHGHILIFPKASKLYSHHELLNKLSLTQMVAETTCTRCNSHVVVELGHRQPELGCYLVSLTSSPTLLDTIGNSFAIFSYSLPPFPTAYIGSSAGSSPGLTPSNSTSGSELSVETPGSSEGVATNLATGITQYLQADRSDVYRDQIISDLRYTMPFFTSHPEEIGKPRQDLTGMAGTTKVTETTADAPADDLYDLDFDEFMDWREETVICGPDGALFNTFEVPEDEDFVLSSPTFAAW